ncbi:hypothetical protein [Algoriphagus sp.]|uniref:hypothetical protein n=1 Tax=Algoriphagus sp. TaxID=1872435 RepID=UPI0025D3D443|nr:hypothetical protein [Algoriphagus sp.]
MKNWFKIVSILVLVTFFSMTDSEIMAQEKVDVVFLKNGEKKEGKVTGITNAVVKFRYTGEDFDYELQKSDLIKIQLASGRVESFGNEAETAAKVSTTPAPAMNSDVHNTIAVLPFQFISNDQSMDPLAMSNLAQNTTANSVKEQYGQLTLQDPITTNALLAKSNIDLTNITTMTPGEIAALLGVEFVIYGTVNLTNKGATTYGSTGTNYSEREKYNANGNNSDTRTKGTIFSSSSSSTTIEYDTSVDFRLFKNNGSNIYSDSRHVFGTEANAYTAGIDYMIKRTPFGSKYGKK